MRQDKVKMCSKCHTLKELVPQRTICIECNLVRKREVAARKLATPEGRDANRAKVKAFQKSEKGREYRREYARNFSDKQITQRNENARKRYVAHPKVIMTAEEKRVHMKVYRAKHRRDNYAKHLHRELRGRAMSRSLPFNLKLSYIEKVMRSGVCEISGLPFQYTERRGPFSMSIDKIKPELGYVAGNVRAVLWCVNAALGDWGLEVVLPVFHAIVDANRKSGV